MKGVPGTVWSNYRSKALSCRVIPIRYLIRFYPITYYPSLQSVLMKITRWTVELRRVACWPVESTSIHTAVSRINTSLQLVAYTSPSKRLDNCKETPIPINMPEIINVHVGQCGNQIGTKVSVKRFQFCNISYSNYLYLIQINLINLVKFIVILDLLMHT